MNQEVKVSVDAVVFGYDQDKELCVLLIRRKYEPFQNRWALPGGLVENDESLDEAVRRELKEETSVEIDHLEQFHAFGNPGRDPRNRVVSVAYYGIVRPDLHLLSAQTDAEDASWFKLKKLPELAFDHQDILNAAIRRMNGEG
jgi:8-oxo-dGTP diphosphatase